MISRVRPDDPLELGPGGTVDGSRLGEVIRLGLILAGIIAGVFIWQAVVVGVPNGGDGWSYWQAPLDHPYDRAASNELLSYLYTPAFLQLLAPLKLLTFEAFNALWVAILVAVAVLLAGPLAFPVLLLPPVLKELEVGNIHILLGLMTALSFRWPSAYAFGLLTKVTPGIGVIWFVVRREWRKAAVALAVTAGIAALSMVVAPRQWLDWLVVFRRPTVYEGAVPISLLLRGPVAALLVLWGARTSRPWTVPVAVTLALPDLWINGLAVLLGAIPLLPWERLPGPLGLSLRPIFDGRPRESRATGLTD